MKTQNQKILETQTQLTLGNMLSCCIDYYTIVFLFITFVCCGYKVLVCSEKIIKSFLICFLTWNVGVRGLIAFVANWAPPLADQIALSYGWPLQNSFQREIAATEGAFGILGILCNWFTEDFWTATVIAVSFCWFFSELGGLTKMTKLKKDPKYILNVALQRGMFLDLVCAILLPVCLILWKKGY